MIKKVSVYTLSFLIAISIFTFNFSKTHTNTPNEVTLSLMVSTANANGEGFLASIGSAISKGWNAVKDYINSYEVNVKYEVKWETSTSVTIVSKSDTTSVQIKHSGGTSGDITVNPIVK